LRVSDVSSLTTAAAVLLVVCNAIVGNAVNLHKRVHYLMHRTNGHYWPHSNQQLTLTLLTLTDCKPYFITILSRNYVVHNHV